MEQRMLFTTIPGDNYAENVYNAIVNDIVNSSLSEGEKLSDKELAQRFGYSRTPIREALIMLERDGFVKTVGREGTYVRRLTQSNIRDIYVVREALETMAARLGAVGVSDDNLLMMDSVLLRMEEIIRRGEDSGANDFVWLDLEFHQLIVRSSGVKLLGEICHNLGLLSASIHCRGTQYAQQLTTYAEQHRAIYQAFANHNAVDAESLLREHIQYGKMMLLLGSGPGLQSK